MEKLMEYWFSSQCFFLLSWWSDCNYRLNKMSFFERSSKISCEFHEEYFNQNANLTRWIVQVRHWRWLRFSLVIVSFAHTADTHCVRPINCSGSRRTHDKIKLLIILFFLQTSHFHSLQVWKESVPNFIDLQFGSNFGLDGFGLKVCIVCL